jgi:IclR family transcriptional regulator, KDG regulon repressor
MTSEPKADMLSKSLFLLEQLGDAPRGATAADLARMAGLPFHTTYRLLKSLTKQGFADYDPEGRRYHLGLQVFRLGQRVAQAHGFSSIAGPILEQVTTQTTETTLLAVPYGTFQLTVSKVDGSHGFGIRSEVGDTAPLHCTAVGKVLVAFAGAEESDKLVTDLELSPHTDRTITDRTTFKREIEKVRALGYATMEEESSVGVNAIAVPVLIQDHAIAALAAAAPALRMLIDEMKSHLPVLQKAAKELAVRLP